MILSNIHKHYKTTLWKKCQFLSLCFLAFASPLFLLCSAISIWWYLAGFFCCNQTHRFISVILWHDLNQFPSTLTSWRVAVRDGTLQLRHTYIDTPTQTLSISFTFTHMVVKAQRQVPIYPHTRHTHTHSYWWFTTSLFSNVLLASSLQLPFVTADRSWQQHLSILPLSLLCQPTLFLSTVTSVSFLTWRKNWG